MENTMNSTTNSAKNDFSRKTDALTTKADNFVKKAKDAGEEVLDSDLGQQISEKWTQFRDRSSDVYSSSVEVVRRHPIAAVSTVLAVGILAGMIMKRRH